jgi:hypothetical protein
MYVEKIVWTTWETWLDLYCREEMFLCSKEPRHFANEGKPPVQWTILVHGT